MHTLFDILTAVVLFLPGTVFLFRGLIRGGYGFMDPAPPEKAERMCREILFDSIVIACGILSGSEYTSRRKGPGVSERSDLSALSAR